MFDVYFMNLFLFIYLGVIVKNTNDRKTNIVQTDCNTINRYYSHLIRRNVPSNNQATISPKERILNNHNVRPYKYPRAGVTYTAVPTALFKISNKRNSPQTNMREKINLPPLKTLKIYKNVCQHL